ncbi:magnesium transporter spict [Rhynchophorus ferrugineus]|uniref:magnesium transporter spict n=1 Tax=Rhynchophorus ferrugineus TaxID=354439 RepID=UPI003FCE15A5
MAEVRTERLNISNLQKADSQFYVGLFLAVISSVFIGSSFIIKKISLNRLNQVGLRASAGGFGYLKDWTWWTGLFIMGIGELANFVAYTFAPASLVTPLGALSVLVSALLASKFLNEALTIKGKMGCVLCILGSTMIVVFAPKEEDFQSIDDLMSRVLQIEFLYYVSIVVVLTFLVIFLIGPKYGNRYVLVYISLCSSVGSLTVMSCKALGISIRSYFEGQLTPDHLWIIALLFLCVVLFICLQLNYLNKALDIFDTSVVTPIYYVMFTTMVICASAILFREWDNMHPTYILGTLIGFSITVLAIFLLNASKQKFLGKESLTNSYNKMINKL